MGTFKVWAFKVRDVTGDVWVHKINSSKPYNDSKFLHSSPVPKLLKCLNWEGYEEQKNMLFNHPSSMKILYIEFKLETQNDEEK